MLFKLTDVLILIGIDRSIKVNYFISSVYNSVNISKRGG